MLFKISQNKIVTFLDGSAGLVVKGGDSCQRVCEFESQCHMTDA